MIKLENISKSLKDNKKILIAIVFGLLTTGFLLPDLYKIHWIGLGENKIISISEEQAVNPNNGKIIELKKKIEQTNPGKTLWDFIGLISNLAIPILGVYLTAILQQKAKQQEKNEQNKAKYQREIEIKKAEHQEKLEREKAEKQAKFEREKATDNLNEQVLQAYIDRISELLIDKNLKDLPYESTLYHTILKVARVRTLSILRRLNNDGQRKGSVVRFLIDAGFITELSLDLSDADLSNANLSNVDLNNADLRLVNFSFANLSHANLSKADLNGNNLTHVNLSKTDLSNSNLSNADLSDAELINADLSNSELIDTSLRQGNLSNADLSDANLSNADLSDADLRMANLSDADLSNADISGAILFNGSTFTGQLLLNFFEYEDKTPEEEYGNITLDQIKQAKHWEKAIYSPEFRKELGLPPE